MCGTSSSISGEGATFACSTGRKKAGVRRPRLTWLSRALLRVGFAVAALSASVRAQVTMEWIPVDATGSHTIDGNNITLFGTDQLVTLEIRLSGWGDASGAPELRSYQARVDPTGYNGVGNPLNPLGWPATPDDGAYVDELHPDYVFLGMYAISTTDTSTIAYRWGGTILGVGGVPDGGGNYYGGTLSLEVPPGAAGTYTIAFEEEWGTFMVDPAADFIPIDILRSARITVADPMGTAFTYQGLLKDGSQHPTTSCKMGFSLWDDSGSADPAHRLAQMTSQVIEVEDGFFTAKVDFGGGRFNGDPRWLELAVCCPLGWCENDEDLVTLSPRVELTPAPYALFSSEGGRGGSWSLNGGDIYNNNPGNVGIGTDAPQSPLHVVGDVKASGNGGSLVLHTPTHNQIYRIKFDNTSLGTFTGDDTQDQQFNFFSEFSLNRTYDAHVRVHGKAAGSWMKYLGITHDGTDGHISTDAGHIVLQPAGNVGIGLTAPTEKLDVGGTARLRGISQGGTGTLAVVVDSAGKLWTSGASRRYKTDIGRLDADPHDVLELNPVQFKWKATGHEDIGLIAEEVDQVLKDLVIYDGEGRPEAVKYDRVPLYLLHIIREQQDRIATLETRLQALEQTRVSSVASREGDVR